ncbi:MAG: HAMP domain-containing histidine kinase [Deltaproteobacteria bacterium]|nr:HAMP domain-containing histidine kinase [Deltaproteobacteria bacterium]
MEDVHKINLRWLIRLRWLFAGGQLAIVLLAHEFVDRTLPLNQLLLLVGFQALSNVAAVLRQRRLTRWSHRPIVGLMMLDVLILTGLLHVGGGAQNPFSFLYLVHIALGAVLLSSPWTWLIVAATIGGYGALFFLSDLFPAQHGADVGHHFHGHLRGMWVAFCVTATLMVFSVHRITVALARRDRELTEARAYAAQAEKLASLTTLAAGAAHELATPLSTIAVASKELERQLTRAAVDAEAIADARLIREQVDRCRDILTQLANRAGEGAEVPQMVTVAALVADARAALWPELDRRVVVDSELTAEKWCLPRRTMCQAIVALIDNAGDASAEGMIRLSGRIEAGRLMITVEDSGCGMSEEILRRATEPFFTSKDAGRGMGLGLFVVDAALKRLGGRLELRSQTGRGTVAGLVLPKVEA